MSDLDEATVEELREKAGEEETVEEEVQVFVEGLDTIPPETSSEEEELPEEYQKLTKAQLVEKIKENEAKATEAGNSAKAIKEAISELGQTLTVPPAEQAAVLPTPTESEAEYEERVKTEVLENPKKVLDEHLRRSVGPLVTSVASGAMQMARELVRIQKGPEAFDKYVTEIDAIVGQAPVTDRVQKPKEIYEKAYNQVMASHLDDLITIRVAEEVAKLKTKGESTTEGPSSGLKAPYGSTQTRVAPKVRTVVLNAREREIADQKGIDYKTYARIYKGE